MSTLPMLWGMNMEDAGYWIKKLNLEPHPEGGFYKETYRSHEIIPKKALPDRFSGDRVFSTCIYYLLNKEDFSAFHRIQQDELWHFYDGSSLTIHIIDPDGAYFTKKLGTDMDEGETPQVVVAAGCFFSAETNDKKLFSLTGCTVAPGFDFADFELPDKNELLALFPQHKELISRFTKKME